MAVPLNTFKSSFATLNAGPFAADSDEVYRCPNGITAIVLMAQCANVGSTTETVTLKHKNIITGEEIELIKDLRVLPSDAVGLITGKLIVEQNNRIVAEASTGGTLKLSLSYLESLNG